MSRRAVVATVVAALLVGRPAAAQLAQRSDAELRASLVHLDSIRGPKHALRASKLPGSSAAEAEKEPPAQVVTAAGMAMLAQRDLPVRFVRSELEAADSLLRAYGGIPATWLAHTVFVESRGTTGYGDDRVATLEPAWQSVLSVSAFAGRVPIAVQWWNHHDSTTNGLLVVDAVTWSYRDHLDNGWRTWLPHRMGVGWTHRSNGDEAVNALANAEEASGRRCLAGETALCAAWLGIDADSTAFRTRYAPEELRAHIQATPWIVRRGPVQACVQGDDAACALAFRSGDAGLGAIPAPDEIRSSLLAFTRDRFGSGVLLRLLQDSTGTVGERLERATGTSLERSLADWRLWVLARGRPERVTAGVGDATAAVAASIALVLLATRRGRWLS